MNEREAAESMREAAAKVADDMARNISAFDIAVQKGGERASKRIAELIRALPIPEPLPDPRDALIGTDVSDAAIAEEEAREIEPQNSGRFALGDFVSKKSGSKWRGCVVGTYATVLTDCGYVIKSWYEPNSVQNYPATALEPWTPPSADDCADATIARLSAELEAARAEIFQTRKFWSDKADQDCSALHEARNSYVPDHVTLDVPVSALDRAVLAKLSKGA